LAIMKDETKEQVRYALRHPVTWWRGADLPEETIHPWENGIQFFGEALKGLMGGFTNIKDRLYLGKGDGKIPPNMKTIHDVTKMTWDGINDPIIGSYMDRKRFGENVHRWVMRFNATFSPIFILLQCFNFGLSPVQRVVQWTLISMFADIMSTSNAVSETKIWAGITPRTQQRGALQLSKTVGNQLASVLSGISTLLMGLQDVIGLNDYQIMIYGAMLFAPLTIFCRWLPSYAKQRVDFTVQVQGEEAALAYEAAMQSNAAKAAMPEAEHQPTFRENIAVVKHNRWFMMWTVVNFIRVILPGTDELFLYRFLIPKLRVGGKELGGEVIYTVKNIIFGGPAFFLQPFAIRVVSKFKDNISFIKTHVIVNIITTSSIFLIGYKSWPRLIFMFAMEMVRTAFDMWSPIPHELIRYEMLDYVEWKTGLRSEGMTTAVDGMLNKLLKNNISSVFGNLVTDWTEYQGWDVPLEKQPPRFLKSIWPLMHLGRIAGEFVVLGALFLYKQPNDPKLVEADLVRRRALALQERAEAAETTTE